jgi:hypothetical protein
VDQMLGSAIGDQEQVFGRLSARGVLEFVSNLPGRVIKYVGEDHIGQNFKFVKQ